MLGQTQGSDYLSIQQFSLRHQESMHHAGCCCPQYPTYQEFDDPQLLLESLTAVKQESERQSTPLRERIATVDALLEDQQGQLSRLLDLYLAGDFEKNVLVDRRNRLDTTIASLERERSDLAGILENRTMSDDKIKRILAFANNQKTKVELATRNFETRRELIEELDVRATLVREENEIAIYASCVLGEEKLRAASTTTIGLRRSQFYD
jgi:hypothetical protein